MCIASRRSLTNQQVNSIVVDEHRHDPRFVFYALRQIAPDVKALAGGAATPIISKSSFSDITVSVPPLAEQRRIASILSAYDDLIENNTRRIAILEEMARRIYEEWFVHFRFPGHEHVRMVESELGPVPEGWRVAQLSAVAERVGKSMSPSAEPDETFEHFSLPAFDASHRPAVEGGSTIMSNKLELDSDVVLLSKLNPRIKRIWVVSGEANRRRVCSTEFLPYKAKPPFTPWFLFLLFDSDRFQSRYIGGAVGTSTSHQRVKPADVDRIDVVVPDLHVIGKFDRIVIPMLQLVDMLRLANTNLRTTRDLLLPKLISGELDVSTLPEPEAVAA
jgi:type I restriction enzyme S subunit